jgi:glycoprotein endo-alpha-1,2-mannosidase
MAAGALLLLPFALQSPQAAVIPVEESPRAASRASTQVVAFYYGWYGTPKVDGAWEHWNDPRLGIRPPKDISTDYYPILGAYSSKDPRVIEQHMAWLRRAQVGVIAVSWWAGETSDAHIKQILDAAAKAGIKVALHIEPVTGRTARSYSANVIRLVRTFGKHPAFFTTTKGSPHVEAGVQRPLVFVWATGVKDLADREEVSADYWAAANDRIHRSVGALVVACPCGGGYAEAVTEGRFDGAYNYATLDLDAEGGFDWARSLPPDALFIPSVVPGFSADRIGYDPSTTVPRRQGQEYDDQWSAALGTGIAPDLVSITSFNEWHEGSSIEPARADYSAGGRDYLDFSPLSPTAYLDRTASWVKRYTRGDYPRPTSTEVRIRVTTTSDWTTLTIANGSLARPGTVTASATATRAAFDGGTIAMNQPLARAQQGLASTLSFTAVALGEELVITGDSGFIGATQLTIERRSGTSWQEMGTLEWVGGQDSGASRTLRFD